MWNSPYCQLYNPYNVSSKNLVFDQLIMSKLIFFFILNIYLVDIVLILLGKNLLWSLMGVRGLKACDTAVFDRALKNQSHLAFPTTTHNQSLYGHESMRTQTA